MNKWFWSAHDRFGHLSMACKSLTGLVYSKNPYPIETTGYKKCGECWLETDDSVDAVPV